MDHLMDLPLGDKRLKVSNSINLSSFDVNQSIKGKGMSLRKWLQNGFIEVVKAERLQIFRQIVDVVDMAHSHGHALQDLRLSNFILLPSKELVYLDSQNNAKDNRKYIDSYHVPVEMEKNWYANACPDELYGRDLFLANIYSLGIILFELLCSFVSLEMHYAAMSDLRNRILPPRFISENPLESGFCLWLLHPHPSSRPTTMEILQSDLLSGTKDFYSKGSYSLIINMSDDAEFEILHDFLISLKEQKENRVLELRESIRLLDSDIRGFKLKNVLKQMFYNSSIFETKIKKNISQLESAYFSMKSRLQLAETDTDHQRNDMDLLGNPKRQEKYVGCIDEFFADICKFIRFNKFEVCGTLKIDNLLSTTNVICCLGFDRDENYIATAGISKKIKIFEFDTLLHDSVDYKYPAVELVNESNLTCVCWNKYVENCLASSDCDGVVQVWDAFTGQTVACYTEHQRRAWCVDFSRVNPTQFASGSDDCSVKLWSLNDKTSTCTIRSSANVCCVQFSSISSHLLAFGCTDYKIQCYDLRNPRIPWCTLAGHQKSVSYAKFLDSDSLVSASTDNTLKLWDLKKTSSEGITTDACSMTYTGHTNEKNFVGLALLDGYISCGSESNEVYTYHKSFPMPIASYKFGSSDGISGDDEVVDNNVRFVSSVCWREKSNMIVAGNSCGSLQVLKIA